MGDGAPLWLPPLPQGSLLPASGCGIRGRSPVHPSFSKRPLLGDTRCHDAAGPPALGNAGSPAYPACPSTKRSSAHGSSSSSPVLGSARARPSMPDDIITWTDQARIWQSRPPASGNVTAPYPRPRRPTGKGRTPSTSGACCSGEAHVSEHQGEWGCDNA